MKIHACHTIKAGWPRPVQISSPSTSSKSPASAPRPRGSPAHPAGPVQQDGRDLHIAEPSADQILDQFCIGTKGRPEIVQLEEGKFLSVPDADIRPGQQGDIAMGVPPGTPIPVTMVCCICCTFPARLLQMQQRTKTPFRPLFPE